MGKQNYHFINTTDPETAAVLRKLGFEELPQDGGRYVFLNEPGKLEFADMDSKINLTNRLNF